MIQINQGVSVNGSHTASGRATTHSLLGIARRFFLNEAPLFLPLLRKTVALPLPTSKVLLFIPWPLDYIPAAVPSGAAQQARYPADTFGDIQAATTHSPI